VVDAMLMVLWGAVPVEVDMVEPVESAALAAVAVEVSAVAVEVAAVAEFAVVALAAAAEARLQLVVLHQ
jgi:hypothetical protein